MIIHAFHSFIHSFVHLFIHSCFHQGSIIVLFLFNGYTYYSVLIYKLAAFLLSDI